MGKLKRITRLNTYMELTNENRRVVQNVTENQR